uniref:VWA domain-containing protein n=1 Tax=Schlesneria paludicola TaxID=360056 RepID=A0A7C4QUR7_9PLAN
MRRHFPAHDRRCCASAAGRRKGVFLVVAALCLIACLTLVAFSVDLGMVTLTKTKMQNATDAAALAAAMEINHAIANAGPDVSDVFDHAKAMARAEAALVAQMNGIYVNPATDVIFGHRRLINGSVQIDWNPSADNINVVKVIARRDNSNPNAPDAKVPALFSTVIGRSGSVVRTESVAYIEPRDMVVVHDFSRSMNFDSYFSDEISISLPQSQLEENIEMVWNDLGPPSLGSLPYVPQFASATKSNTGASATVIFKGKSVDVSTNTNIKTVVLKFENGASQTFNISNETTKSGTWSGTGGNSNRRISSVDVTIRRVGSSSQSWTLTGYNYDTNTVRAAFGLTSVPYPYSGGSWSEYVSFVKTNAGLAKYGYQDKFGAMTFVCYVLRMRCSYANTKDLWKTRHYPFHAIKEGHYLLCDFLADLGFDDQLGMVSYDTYHRVETTINDPNPELPYVNISADPITNQYGELKKLMKYKQAGHYYSATNMSGGLKSGIQLIDNHKRVGSRPCIILMTDGNSNTLDPGEDGSLPSGWNWNVLFDYNNDGVADYSTSDVQRRAVLKYVKLAVDKGYTVHAISVGADADRDLLKAVAHLGRGYWVDVPGGMCVSDVEDEMKAAFTKIAAAVPPARLIRDDH